MKKMVWFDMDGTIANLYAVENWLPKLRDCDASPYAEAEVMLNMNTLARLLNKLQKQGYGIGIISWLSKSSTPEYDEAVTAAKLWWLRKHLNSVKWDAVNIVAYGRNKWDVCGEGILFDDEAPNREAWGGEAFHPAEMMKILSSLQA